MTEYPLLCISPHCRSADKGGPRRTERAWVCPVCIDNAADDLRAIADAWADLEEALITSGSTHGEPVTGSHDVGLALNEPASRARAEATAIVWFMVRDLLDRYDEAGRTLILPRDESVPGIARWLAQWHVAGFAAHPGDDLAVEVLGDIRSAARHVRSAAYPSGARKVGTGLPCTEHATSDLGERVPCAGSMVAWVRPQMDGLPDLVCDADETHRLDPATWQRAGWKRAHAGPLDTAAMGRLASRLDLRTAT